MRAVSRYQPVAVRFGKLSGELGGIIQAVQGSIDATSTPSTEEEAFRQNQGRELGPIGAFKALSLRAPVSPAGSGGILATPQFVDIARNIGNRVISRAVSSFVAGINPQNPKLATPQQRLADRVSKSGSLPPPIWGSPF